MHARGVALAPNVDLRTIAARTPGFTGADLENVVNEAALLAARREKNAVTMDELEEAIDRVVDGPGAQVPRDEREGEATASPSHEMGHALVAHYSDEPRPGAPHHDHPARHRGARSHHDPPARGPLPRHRARAQGHARRSPWAAASPRSSCYGEISTGAQNDLEKATQIARAMVAEYGMSEKVGPALARPRRPERVLQQRSQDLRRHGREDRRGGLAACSSEAHDQAERLLKEHRDLLDRSRRAPARGRDDRRRGPRGLRVAARSRSLIRRRSRARRRRPTRPRPPSAEDAPPGRTQPGGRPAGSPMPPDCPPMPTID